MLVEEVESLTDSKMYIPEIYEILYFLKIHIKFYIFPSLSLYIFIYLSPMNGRVGEFTPGGPPMAHLREF